MDKIDRIDLIEINRIYARDKNDYDFNRYAITAELRVIPFSNLANKHTLKIAITLVDENLLDFDLKHKLTSSGDYVNHVFYSVMYKEFEAETPIEQIYNFLEAEQQKLQEKFSELLDKAYMVETLTDKKLRI